MSQPSFGQVLKYWRSARDLTQSALAEHVGYSVSALRKLESGMLRPSRDLARRLADVLQLSGVERTRFLELARTPATKVGAVPPSASDRFTFSLSEPSFDPPLLHVPPLVGRQVEIQSATQMLLLPHIRLLTLAGPGGVGKTRLSVALADVLKAHFPDGTVFVPLADIRDPSLVASTLVHTLGLPPLGTRLPIEQIIAYLQGKSLLLVLDNFEHLVAAAPVIAELLRSTPGVKVLTTSRTTLGLHNEHVYQVPPLPVPPQDAAPTLATVQAYPATALFVQRLWATDPDIELTPPDLVAVIAICRKLQGLPLALDLAARRCRLFSLQELLDRLQRRLSVLQDTDPDRLARHQTLYATIDWSYQLLDEAVQTLFARLAVLDGSWSLDAATTICDPHRELPVSVVDGLTILLNHSLIALVPQADVTPRYTMLETLREFAHDRLAERGEELTIRQQHLAYYLFLAEEAARHYNRADETVWLDTLEKERYNLWAAAQWTDDHGPVEDALRLGGFLGHFWTRRGSWHDALRWLTSVLALTEETAPERIMALESTLILAGKIGDFAVIQTYAEEILRVAQVLGSLHGEAVGDLYLGYAAHARGDDTTAEAHSIKALELFQEAGDGIGVARVRYQQWRLAAHHGQITVGLPFLEEAVHYSRALGNKVGLAQALNDLGAVRAEVEGRYAEARALTEEGLELFRSVRDVWGTCYALRNLGEVLLAEGELAQARQLFEESLAIAHRYQHGVGIAVALVELGVMAWCEGNLASAGQFSQESLERFREQHDRWGASEAQRCLGHIAYRENDREVAHLQYLESLRGYRRINIVTAVPVVLLGLAWCRLHDDYVAAAQIFGAAEVCIDSRDFGLHVFQHDRVVIAEISAQFDAMMIDNALVAARKTGQRMSLEQVVDDVLNTQ